MTSEEIVKSLRCCATVDGSGCYECPARYSALKSSLDCDVLMKIEAADLIERLSAENADLRKENERMEMDIAIINAVFRFADFERMKVLAEADKEGRVVLLPPAPEEGGKEYA